MEHTFAWLQIAPQSISFEAITDDLSAVNRALVIAAAFVYLAQINSCNTCPLQQVIPRLMFDKRHISAVRCWLVFSTILLGGHCFAFLQSCKRSFFGRLRPVAARCKLSGVPATTGAECQKLTAAYVHLKHSKHTRRIVANCNTRLLSSKFKP